MGRKCSHQCKSRSSVYCFSGKISYKLKNKKGRLKTNIGFQTTFLIGILAANRYELKFKPAPYLVSGGVVK